MLCILCDTSIGIAQQTPDTLVIDGVTIIRDSDADTSLKPERKGLFKKLNSKIRPKNIKTEWGVIDLGVSNHIDNTNYAGAAAQAYAPGSNEEWLDIKPFKSRNVNIWFVRQTVNMIQYYVNFQYGLGLELNNYHYKQPIRYDASPPATENPPTLYLDNTLNRSYKKDKLAVNYITVPLLLNFNLTPTRLYPFELGAGISIGYLYSARNKTITSDEGKLRARDDFDLNHWKLSYVGELSLGVVTFYGSCGFKSMYKRGLDITPYNIGLRIRPVEIFSKLETP